MRSEAEVRARLEIEQELKRCRRRCEYHKNRAEELAETLYRGKVLALEFALSVLGSGGGEGERRG